MKSAPSVPLAYESLENVLASCWSWMERGVQDRRCPTHHPTFSTLRTDGRPTARTVILRECLRGERVLGFHTDRRSRKWQELEGGTAASLHVYLPQPKLQFRFVGATERVVDPEANLRRWLQMHPNSRRCYQSDLAPGSRVESPEDISPPDDDPLTGIENFGWVRFHVDELEWLYLSSCGHQRALFTWEEELSEHATWLVP